MRFRLVVLVVAAVLALAAAVSAQAASMVYVQGGNVWLSNVDGTSPRQVTSGGSTATPGQTAYRSPTEANDGTIVALKGGNVVRVTENGTVLSNFAPDTHEYPLTAALSPDGSTVAYNFSQLTACTLPPYFCGVQPQPGSDVTPANAGASKSASIQEGEQDGRWIGNGALVLQNDSSYIDYQVLGGSAQHWFAPNGIAYNVQPVVSRDEKYLVSVLRSSSSGGNPSAGDLLQVFQVNGFPGQSGTTDPTLLCQFQALNSGGFQQPDISPDDSTLIWYDNGGEERTTLPAGCSGGASPTTFTLSGGGTFMPNATQASFGEATNAPAARPAPAAAFSSAGLKIAKSLKRAALLKQGIKASLSCNSRCAYAVVVGVDNSTARKLRLTKKGQVVLGYVKGTFNGGKQTVTIKFTAKVRNAVRRSRSETIRLIVEVAAKGADSKRVAHVYTVTISR